MIVTLEGREYRQWCAVNGPAARLELSLGEHLYHLLHEIYEASASTPEEYAEQYVDEDAPKEEIDECYQGGLEDATTAMEFFGSHYDEFHEAYLREYPEHRKRLRDIFE